MSDCWRPGLAVVTLERSGGGLAYAGRLLRQGLVEIAANSPSVVSLQVDRLDVSVPQKARFATRVIASQALARTDFWLFGHVGLSRVQDLLPARWQKPYAVLTCGIEVWDRDLRDSERRALMRATSRIAISRFTAERLKLAYPEVGLISVCPLGLLPEDSGRKASPRISEGSRPTVLIVGRMISSERYKGHDALLECWPEVLRRIPAVELLIVGQGDDMPRLQAKAASLGIHGSVRFTGFVTDDELQRCWESASIFVLPGWGEGFGLVYAEAMSHGIPCIGSELDASAEIVRHEETGFLVNPHDRDELTSSIVRLLGDANLRTTMGMAGRRVFEREYSWTVFRDRLGAILLDAFANRANN